MSITVVEKPEDLTSEEERILGKERKTYMEKMHWDIYFNYFSVKNILRFSSTFDGVKSQF